MLMLVLVAATMGLCPLVRAQPLCRARTVKTGKVFNVVQEVDGDVLYFPSMTPRVIKHPCRKNVAVYLGRQIFFTTDDFESSLRPLTIPTSMQVGVPAVTSAHFIGPSLLLVVNWKVYIYNFEDASWEVPVGIRHPVSHISGDHCCYVGNTFCVHMSFSIFAYLHGEPVSRAHIYKSTTGGRRFKKYTYIGQGTFKYSHHPLNRSLGLAFDYNETLDVLIIPGHRGLLILWSDRSLLYSHNSGQLVDSIPVKRGEQILYRSISQANITIHTIAFNENELAVLTKEDRLYYGSLRLLSSSIIKIEYLDGNFLEKMYTIDMHSKLEFSAALITRLGTSPIPLVMVSNPHSLGLQASMSENGNTLDGTILYQLEIYLKQQQHWGRTDPNFTSSLRRATISTLTVDIANKEMSCVDIKPLSTLISVGCDLEKKIVVQNKISACSKGVLDPMALQDNHTYIIEKEFYDLSFQGRKSTEDLVVYYPYNRLGCPRLVYYDTPWRPVVELWKQGHFQEVIQAEYVLREVSGVFTYSYSLTAKEARCVSQPQNWTTIIQETEGLFWDRENYVSCHDSENSAPLRWPEVQYQILGGRTQNSIIFDQRNGIYIFFLSIVDPYYSYCHLQTTFSIYVHGAYPLLILPPGLTIAMLVASILLSVWLAYVVPKVLHTEKGHRIKRFGARLCWRCKRLCTCHWPRSPKLALEENRKPPGKRLTSWEASADL
ncbi:cation channel sperm-associated protein subunit delta [Lemur catta]|uniref:cation channel sperm-associated protein subunit delta n=1 Tax=Lemur catta TaxID=9447 RepID=UPI001E26ADAD|nr:cation channel sperm-associated protein subunit delta [Lemur catta]